MLGEITVRKKMVFAYVSAVILFIAAAKILSMVQAHVMYFLAVALVFALGLFIYATGLKCPHCGARAFSRRWLALFYIPRTCAHCDREFYD